MVQRSGVCGNPGLHALRKVGEVERGCGCEVQFRLSAGNECWRGCLAEVCRAGAQAKPSFTLRQRIARVVGVAQTHPSHRQPQRVITVLRGIALDVIELFPDGVFHHSDQRQCLAFHVCLQRAVAVHHRPAALLPTYRSQHRLTSHHMLQITAGAVAQTNHPPRGVGSLHKVSMPQSLYLTVLHLHVEVRQDRVVRVRLIWTEKVLAAKDVHMMPVLRSAFSQQQIIVTVLLIDMRSFGIAPAKSCAQVMYLAQLPTRLHINLANLDVALFPEEIAFVILKVERGVATADGEVYHDGFRPLASRIVGPYVEMTARGEHRCHHIEAPIVITDGGGVDAAVAVGSLQVDLRRTGKTVAHLFPVHQVLRVEHRNTREILKRAVYQIEVVARPAYTRVGMKPGKHGIAESLRLADNHFKVIKAHPLS